MTEKEKPIPNKLLRGERERRGWTRDYVAEQISSDYQTVARWERGTTSPSPYYRQELCKLFGMNAQELGFLKEDNRENAELLQGKAELPGGEVNIGSAAALPTKRNFIPPFIGDGSLAKFLVWGGVIVAISILLSLLFFKLLAPAPDGGSSGSQATQPARFIQTSNAAPGTRIKPGGTWVNPANGQIEHGMVHFVAQAYPTNHGDPAIDHINFTVTWPGGHWQVACIAYAPASGNVFTCDANLSSLDAPAGQIKVSFDVYDKNGNVNFAPNGVHTIMYFP